MRFVIEKIIRNYISCILTEKHEKQEGWLYTKDLCRWYISHWSFGFTTDNI